MTKKITAPLAKMMEIAKEHKARGEAVRIFEAEHPHTGRIILVMEGKHILIMW